MTAAPRHVIFGPGAIGPAVLAAEPYIVDSSKITNKLGVEATPLPRALGHALEEYRRE